MEEPAFAAAIDKERKYEGTIYIGESIEEIRMYADRMKGRPCETRKINLPWHEVLKRLFTCEGVNESTRDRVGQNIQHYFKGGVKVVSLLFYFVPEHPFPFKESELEKAVVEASSQNR